MPDSDATSSDEGDMHAGAQQPPQHPPQPDQNDLPDQPSWQLKNASMRILGISLIIHIFVQLGPGLKSKTKAEH